MKTKQPARRAAGKRVAVLGAGSWGTTFAKILADGGADVMLWARRPEMAREIQEAKRNSDYLPGVNLPLGLRPADVEWEPGRVRVGRGDLLVSVSDGALDAYDSTLESLRMIGDDLRAAADPGGFFDELALKVSTHEVDDDVTAVVLSVH